jgi:hypothetical protein
MPLFFEARIDTACTARRKINIGPLKLNRSPWRVFRAVA